MYSPLSLKHRKGRGIQFGGFQIFGNYLFGSSYKKRILDVGACTGYTSDRESGHQDPHPLTLNPKP